MSLWWRLAEPERYRLWESATLQIRHRKTLAQVLNLDILLSACFRLRTQEFRILPWCEASSDKFWSSCKVRLDKDQHHRVCIT